jgi:hypothetical protein
LITLGSFLLSCVLCELAFRKFETRLVADPAEFAELRRFIVDGHPTAYEPRPHTVYGRRRNTPTTNALGFKDSEWTLEKTPGLPRIACLGSSTTEGGHPLYLEEMLLAETGRRFEVMNCGTSGWMSAEVLVSWFLTLQDYSPDLVILHEGVNDVFARKHPGFRADYSHYRHHWDPPSVNPIHRCLTRTSGLYSWLTLRGDPSRPTRDAARPRLWTESCRPARSPPSAATC